MLQIACTFCGKQYQLDAAMAGKSIRCRQCEQVFVAAAVAQGGPAPKAPAAPVAPAPKVPTGPAAPAKGGFNFPQKAQIPGFAPPAAQAAAAISGGMPQAGFSPPAGFGAPGLATPGFSAPTFTPPTPSFAPVAGPMAGAAPATGKVTKTKDKETLIKEINAAVEERAGHDNASFLENFVYCDLQLAGLAGIYLLWAGLVGISAATPSAGAFLHVLLGGVPAWLAAGIVFVSVFFMFFTQPTRRKEVAISTAVYIFAIATGIFLRLGNDMMYKATGKGLLPTPRESAAMVANNANNAGQNPNNRPNPRVRQNQPPPPPPPVVEPLSIPADVPAARRKEAEELVALLKSTPPEDPAKRQAWFAEIAKRLRAPSIDSIVTNARREALLIMCRTADKAAAPFVMQIVETSPDELMSGEVAAFLRTLADDEQVARFLVRNMSPLIRRDVAGIVRAKRFNFDTELTTALADDVFGNEPDSAFALLCETGSSKCAGTLVDYYLRNEFHAKSNFQALVSYVARVESDPAAQREVLRLFPYMPERLEKAIRALGPDTEGFLLGQFEFDAFGKFTEVGSSSALSIAWNILKDVATERSVPFATALYMNPSTNAAMRDQAATFVSQYPESDGCQTLARAMLAERPAEAAKFIKAMGKHAEPLLLGILQISGGGDQFENRMGTPMAGEASTNAAVSKTWELLAEIDSDKGITMAIGFLVKSTEHGGIFKEVNLPPIVKYLSHFKENEQVLPAMAAAFVAHPAELGPTIFSEFGKDGEKAICEFLAAGDDLRSSINDDEVFDFLVAHGTEASAPFFGKLMGDFRRGKMAQEYVFKFKDSKEGIKALCDYVIFLLPDEFGRNKFDRERFINEVGAAAEEQAMTYLRHPNPLIRARAVDMLMYIGTRKSVSSIREATKDNKDLKELGKTAIKAINERAKFDELSNPDME